MSGDVTGLLDSIISQNATATQAAVKAAAEDAKLKVRTAQAPQQFAELKAQAAEKAAAAKDKAGRRQTASAPPSPASFFDTTQVTEPGGGGNLLAAAAATGLDNLRSGGPQPAGQSPQPPEGGGGLRFVEDLIRGRLGVPTRTATENARFQQQRQVADDQRQMMAAQRDAERLKLSKERAGSDELQRVLSNQRESERLEAAKRAEVRQERAFEAQQRLAERQTHKLHAELELSLRKEFDNPKLAGPAARAYLAGRPDLAGDMIANNEGGRLRSTRVAATEELKSRAQLKAQNQTIDINTEQYEQERIKTDKAKDIEADRLRALGVDPASRGLDDRRLPVSTGYIAGAPGPHPSTLDPAGRAARTSRINENITKGIGGGGFRDASQPSRLLSAQQELYHDGEFLVASSESGFFASAGQPKRVSEDRFYLVAGLAFADELGLEIPGGLQGSISKAVEAAKSFGIYDKGKFLRGARDDALSSTRDSQFQALQAASQTIIGQDAEGADLTFLENRINRITQHAKSIAETRGGPTAQRFLDTLLEP